MPIVSVEQGNLLDKFKEKRFDAIAHGCNCYHVMGKGIAGQIASEFPGAFRSDKETPIGDTESKLGSWSKVNTGFGTIFNLYTQRKPGKEDQEVLNTSIERAFRGLDSRLAIGHFNFKKIGIPMIGTGIAKGDWDQISTIIDKATPNLDIYIVDVLPKLNPKPAMKVDKKPFRGTENIVEYWLG